MAAPGARGDRPDLRAGARGRRAGLPGHREPERRDRPPVPGLNEDPRADRLGGSDRSARGDQAAPRVVLGAPRGATRRRTELSAEAARTRARSTLEPRAGSNPSARMISAPS